MYVSHITNIKMQQPPNNPELYAHNTIWNFFSNPSGESVRDYIFRYNGSDQFFSYSSRAPIIPPNESYKWSVKSIPFNPTFLTGSSFRFCSRLNTVIHTKDGFKGVIELGKKNGTFPDVSITQFLEHRGNGSFKVDSLMIERIRVVKFHKKDGNPVTIEGVDVVGSLTIADPNEFTKILFRGIGKEKCYGYGMLLLN